MNRFLIRKRTVFIFLTLIGLLSYFNSFRVPFHYDDISFLREKTIIKSFSLFFSWISEDYLRIITGRAFLLFTFSLNYMISGLDTFGYHFVNLFIHISTAFLFYQLLAKYVDNENGDNYHFKSILASSLFLLHPINTESVTYISSRSSGLSTFFILTSMLCFFKATSPHLPFAKGGQEGGQHKFYLGFYLLSILFFILGLSTKEAAIVTPILIILFDIYFISENGKNLKSRLKYHLPFWALISIAAFYYSGRITNPEMYDRPWLTHILTESKVFTEYLRLLILPFGLNFDHDIKESLFFDPQVIISVVIVTALLSVAVLIKSRNRILSFSILWFFINLAPFLAIRLSDYMTERWVYAAALGFSLGLVELVMIVTARHKRIGVIILAGIMLLFGSLTILRNNVYKSPVTLWADALKKSPEKIRPYTNLSASYLERGEIDKAIDIMERSIQKGNNQLETYLNLANAYFLKDNLKKAEDILLMLRDEAVPYIYHYNLGMVYKHQKKYKKSIEEFKTVLKTKPHSTAALGSIGECYDLLNQKDKAKEYFILATKGIPQNSEDYLMQAKSYFNLGDKQKGTESLNNALIAEPFNIYIRNIIATTLLENNRFDEALKHFSAASKISPNYAPAYKGMGLAMLRKGNKKKAAEHFKKALNLLPVGSAERKEIEELLAQVGN